MRAVLTSTSGMGHTTGYWGHPSIDPAKAALSPSTCRGIRAAPNYHRSMTSSSPSPFREVHRPNFPGLETLGAAASAALLVVASAVFFGAAADAVREHDGMTRDDASVLRFFTDHRSGLFDSAAKVATDIGAAPVLALVAVVAGVVLWRRKTPVGVAIAPLIALFGAGFTVLVVKSAFGRARPPVSLHLVAESDASFPSGHATDSAGVILAIALATAMYIFRKPVARWISVFVGALLTGAIGVSRLALGVHWPTDILAGWALGTCIAILSITLCSTLARIPMNRPESDQGWANHLLYRTRSVLAHCRAD